MNKTHLLVAAALVSASLASSAYASTPITDYINHYTVVRTDVPLPVQVVSPTDLPSRYVGSTVTLQLTVDSTGIPRDITVVSPSDPELTRSVTKAIAQWRFTPATKDGVPVETRIELPLQLKDTRNPA